MPATDGGVSAPPSGASRSYPAVVAMAARIFSRIWFVAALAMPGPSLAAAALPPSLAAEVAAAQPGATITVPAGIYRGGILIARPLTLIGRPGAVIDAGGKGDVIRIAASHVTVRGFVLKNSGTSLTDENAGIFVDKKAVDVTVADNDLKHVLFGIYLDGPAGTRVLHNRIRGITALRVPDRGDGIHLWDDTGVLVEGNDVGDTRDGIYIYVSPHNRIIDNRMHDVRYGVHYMYSNHDLLAGNISYHNTAGYALMMSDHVRVYDNLAYEDVEYGMLMNYVTYSELVGNRIWAIHGQEGTGGALVLGAGGKGVFVYDSEYDRLRDNRISDCWIGIHVTAGSDDDIFTDNSFVANRVQVKYVQNATQEWSWRGVGNYWSDYRGWDLNGDGIGDVPYRPNDGVDVLLWNYPSASLLMSSPAVLILRYVQRAFPVFSPPGVQDSHPLMHPPAMPPILQRRFVDASRN